MYLLVLLFHFFILLKNYIMELREYLREYVYVFFLYVESLQFKLRDLNESFLGPTNKPTNGCTIYQRGKQSQSISKLITNGTKVYYQVYVLFANVNKEFEFLIVGHVFSFILILNHYFLVKFVFLFIVEQIWNFSLIENE